MKTQGWAALVVALALAACGGGGGGSSDAGGGSGNGGGTGGGGDGGGSGAGDPNGTAEILFPPTRSAASAPTVTVRGTAADPEGVARVLINGTAATIGQNGAASLLKPSTKGGLAEGEVEWSAEVPLATGENELVISVEDETGEVTEGLDEATITYVEVPVTFSLDADGARLVGLSWTLTPSGRRQHLVQHNYDTLEQAIFEGVGPINSTNCLRPFENELLYLSFFTGTWELRKYDLETGEDAFLMYLPPEALDGGANFQSGSVREMVCDGTHTSAYVLVNHTDEDGRGHGLSGYAKSRVVEIDLATFAVTTLSETDVFKSPRWIAEHIALADDAIVTLHNINDIQPLTAVSLVDGARTELALGLEVGGFVLEPALGIDRVYVATPEGIDEVDLLANSKRNISVVDEDHPFSFEEIRSIGFDPVNNRVIVGDSSLDALIAIDATTGERSDFLSHKVGSGFRLIAPRAFEISADGTHAYIADDGGNVSARLFEIDLASGDRRTIGDIDQPFSVFVRGLALDEAGARVFVSIGDLVLEVDLETEEVQTIASSAGSPELESITDVVLDAENGRLLLGDFINDGIYALDLASHVITPVSQAGLKGDGPAFGGVLSMARVPATPVLYVAAQTSGVVTRVSLETGEREELLTGCDFDFGAPTFQNLEQVLYNESGNELIISADRLHSFDLDTADCDRLPRSFFALHLGIAPGNRMLATDFGTLMQYDRTTGEVAIVSK